MPGVCRDKPALRAQRTCSPNQAPAPANAPAVDSRQQMSKARSARRRTRHYHGGDDRTQRGQIVQAERPRRSDVLAKDPTVICRPRPRVPGRLRGPRTSRTPWPAAFRLLVLRRPLVLLAYRLSRLHGSDHRPHRHQRMCTDTGAHFWRKCTTTVRLRTRQTQAASSPGAEPAMGATRATSANGTHPIDRVDRVGRSAALTLTGHRPARAAS